MRNKVFGVVALSALLLASQSMAEPLQKSFVFGAKAKAANATTVAATDLYTPTLGYGFEGAAPAFEAKSAAGAPFFFSVDVPEGNYKLTVTLGGNAKSDTTVKAELRRLMLETVAAPAKGSVTKTFIVNVRTPKIPDGGEVKLKAPREVVTEARAWDERITLEFNGNPAIRSLKVEAVEVPTVYLLGDSTVCDQSGEPYASWGQMLPRFFKPTVAIANHGESGESVAAANGARRFDKIESLIKPGDYFIVQFGHNDMKAKANDPDAALKYKAGLIDWVKRIKAKGATPIIVTPMNRHSFKDGVVVNSLEEYPEMARQAASETGTALIDLNGLSKTLYEALGEEGSLSLFMHSADYSKKDATHHSPYGAYELAKVVVEAMRQLHVPIASEVIDGLPPFDPAHPDKETDFAVPPSISFATVKPLGS